MTQYCYVMSDGSNDGTNTSATLYTSRQTTDFATLTPSNYYASIADAITYNTLVDGDEIICANTHDHDYGVTTTLTVSAIIYSVLYTDLTSYQKGASETVNTGNGDLLIRSTAAGRLFSSGVDFSADDDFLTQSTNTRSIFSDCDCTILGVSSDETINARSDGSHLTLTNVNVGLSNDGRFTIGGGGRIEINGGSISGSMAYLFYSPGNGGGSFQVCGVDFSGVTSTASILSPLLRTSDSTTLKIGRCKLSSTLSIFNSTLAADNQTIDAYSCDNGDGYHYFESHRYVGVASEDTTTYLDATYDGTNGFSTLLESNVNASRVSPLRIKLCEIPAQDLTTSKTFKVNFTSASALDTADFFFELVRPDATYMALGVTQSSGPADILTAGGTLTTNSPGWTVGKTYQYEDELSITGMTGVDNGSVEVWVNLTLANTDVWIDPLVVIT